MRSNGRSSSQGNARRGGGREQPGRFSDDEGDMSVPVTTKTLQQHTKYHDSKDRRGRGGRYAPSEPLMEEDDMSASYASYERGKKGYPEAAGVGLDYDDDDRSSMRSARSGRSGVSKSSRASSYMSRGSHSKMSQSSHAISEDLPWRQSAASDFGDYRSDAGTSITSVGSAARRDSFEEREDGTPVVLLKSSAPAQVGNVKGRYVLRVVRASLKQPYGITFDANEARGGMLSGISVAEDLPHLGIRKWDELMSVNGAQPRSIHECRGMLQEALSILLVLQRRGVQSQAPPPKPHLVVASLSPMDRVLLSVSKAVVSDQRRGEFKLSIHRNSLKQKFGLAFEAVLSKTRVQELSILISEDLPHLALIRNDRLYIINGIRPRSRKVCAQILKSAMTVNLTFRRDPTKLKHHLTHLVQSLSDIEDEEAYGGNTVLEKPCCLMLSGCFMDRDSGNGQSQHHVESSGRRGRADPGEIYEEQAFARNSHGMMETQTDLYVYDAMGGSMNMQGNDGGLLCTPQDLECGPPMDAGYHGHSSMRPLECLPPEQVEFHSRRR
mmetsp:Transcript_19016/g.36624  ORF Transcript_19016/g.36624 Transcript_19016/m.36624 type:complete len:552 (+) Transcript_19016:127-1782(+)